MKPMRTAVIVQARMGSTRLPGKVAMSVGGRSLLEEVLQRCRAIPGVDIVVCATPDDAENEPLRVAARVAGAVATAGSSLDVLARYAAAARLVEADIVMRVTSDCPLVDPTICGQVLALRERSSADYAANNLVRTFPHGLDCEAFTVATLWRAESNAKAPYEREHVTPWMRTAPDVSRQNLHADDPRWAQERWTVDFPEDLEFVRQVIAALPQDDTRTSQNAVLAVLDENPGYRLINAMHRATTSGSV
jgi:spore coat polysaccharide biosynthesis protein SpsF